MLRHATRLIAGAMVLVGTGTAVMAADLYEPPVYEAPPAVEYVEAQPYGGWYIRGDLDYHKMGWRGADYITYGCCTPVPGTDNFTSGSIRPSFSLGAGVGYQVNKHFRVDLTGDYFFKSRFRGSTDGTPCGGGGPCTSTDESRVSTWLLMANAYADLGTYGRVTPYVGAGIGGAHVSWDNLENTITPGAPIIHEGAKSWRFAYALMAGASYCISRNLKLDVGYRFAHIQGGRMFQESGQGVGPGFDRGFNVHEGRAGLRYQFGGGKDCGAPKEAYVPYEPEPVTPIYK